MPILATIVLDSGAFLQNINDDPEALDVGYFQCAKDHFGNDVPDIRIYVDGELMLGSQKKLGKGTINVVQKKGGKIKISPSLKKNLLRIEDLYRPEPPPPYDHKSIECKLHFTSGTFRCSKLKDRRFIKVPIGGGQPTEEQFKKPIAHDVIVHFNLDDGDELSLGPEHGKPMFTTASLDPGTTHVEIELVCNNPTAHQFFCDALDLSGKTHYWVPNQGDPTSTGTP